MGRTKEKLGNFATAVYIAEKYGDTISDEHIKTLAKQLKMYPNVLLKNYKSVVNINNIFNQLK